MAAIAAPARPNGWWGMAIFVATEATLFGVFIGSWIYLGLENPSWPPRGLPAPPVLTPTLLTAALLSTSLFMQLAWLSGRAWDRRRAWLFVAAAFVVQTFYFTWQAHDFELAVRAYPPDQTAFSSLYITLLGADHFHVFVGLLLQFWLLIRLATKLTRYRLVALHATTFYTHAVNAITLAVLLTTIAPSL